MPRNDHRTESTALRLKAVGRVFTACAVSVATLALAGVRAPARGADKSNVAESKTAIGAGSAPRFFRDDVVGGVVIRPAAALRHPGVDRLLAPYVFEIAGGLAFALGLEPAKADFRKLDGKRIDWVTSYLRLGQGRTTPEGKKMHSLGFGGPAVRMVEPFDWLEFARNCGFEPTGAKEAGVVYYKLGGPIKRFLGSSPCLYIADGRTAWIDEEEVVKRFLASPAGAPPAFLAGPEWDRAREGLVAVAVDNHDGSLLKDYDLGRTDDAVVLALFKDVERVTLSVDDADLVGFRAAALCRPGVASTGLVRALDGLVKQARVHLDQAAAIDPKVGRNDAMIRLAKGLLANLRVEHADGAVSISASGFGRLADVASMVEAELNREQKPAKPRDKVGSKTIER